MNKGSGFIHFLDSSFKKLKCVVVLNVFVTRKIKASLILLYDLDEMLELISVNLVPKHIFPGLKLTINDRNEIPHLLQLDKLILAIVKLLLIKDLQLFSLLLHLAILDIILINLCIGCINHLGARLRCSRGHVCQELLSVVEDLDLELSHSDLHVIRFFGLQWQNGFFDGSKSVVGSVLQRCSRIFDGDQKVDALRHTHVNVVLLKKLNGVAECWEALDCLLFDLSDVSEVGHHLGKEILLALRPQVSGQLFDTSRYLFDETLCIFELLCRVIVEEAGESFNPAVDNCGELLDQRS